MGDINQEMAIVLNALTLQDKNGDVDLDGLESRVERLSREMEAESAFWQELTQDLVVGEADEVLPEGTPNLTDVDEQQRRDWDSLVAESREYLKQNGIDPGSIKLPISEHDLLPMDLGFSFLIALFTIMLPSIGGREYSIQAWFSHIQKLADSGQLPGLLQSIFGRNPAPFLDIRQGGPYHRYVFGHDLLQAIPLGWSQAGMAGVIEVFQHLLTDSFGLTGIPVPGSTMFLEFLAKLMGQDGIEGLLTHLGLRHSDLARYTGLRAVDGVVTIATSLLLSSYFSWQRVPKDSLRRPKMAVITHGLCTVGVAAAASIPGLAPTLAFRSHINYVSFAGMVKNCVSLKKMTSKMQAENRGLLTQLEDDLLELKKYADLVEGEY